MIRGNKKRERENNMKKKKAAAVILAAVIVVSTMLTGCGGSKGASGKDSGKTELTMLMGSSEDKQYIEYMQNLISDFEDANTDIKINLSLVSDPEGQIKQQMAAGGGPDIVNTDPTSMHILASSDYLVKLDDYAAQYGWGDRFDDWVKDSLSYDGSWYGLPGVMDGMLVYYNKDLFAENGWEIPTNYDEVLSLCKEMTEKGYQAFPFGSSGYKQANQWWTSVAYCAGMGQEDLHKLLTGKLDWTCDASKATVEKLNELWSNNYIYKDSTAIKMDDARTLFTSGKAGMYMSGTWDASPIDDAAPGFNWGVFEMPSWREGVAPVLPVALGGSFSINAKCTAPDAAAKLLDYMYQSDVAAQMIKFGTLYPEKNLDISNIDVNDNIKMVQKYLDEALANGSIGYCAWTYWPANTDTYAWNNIESVVMGQLTVDEYCENLQKNFETDTEKGNVLDF